ncbi:MAG: hypothetical protein ACYDHF_08015 [Candidatus Cryosericum sp.]
MADNLVPKITIKSIAGAIDLEKLLKAENKEIALAHIFGLARKAAPDSSQYGDFIRFRGSFKAINIETGETMQSGSLILPSTAQELLAGAFSEETTEVKFGFQIGVKYDPKVATKYTYTVVSLTPAAQNDPLLALEAQIKNELKALTAPKEETGGKKKGA